MKKTKNYAMPYPEQDDYFNVEDFQDMMVSVDDLMKKLSDSGAQISSDAEHLYNQTKAQMDNIQKRMNAFTALKEGSTTGDAELTDIRVAYDGKEYGNAGEAVREQASDIHKALFGAGASIWSKAKSESTKYVAETKGICILNERFTAAGVVAKISRGTFAQNESTLNLDRECSAYIVEFEKNPGTVYMPSAETIKIVSTTKIIFEANGNARCWIPVKKGQYLAVDSTAIAYTSESNHVPYMLYDQANKTLECRGFGSTGSIEPVDPYSLALEYKLEYDMDDTGLVKQIDANREDVASLKEDKVDKPSATDDGKIPRAKEGGVEWVEAGQPTDEQTNSAVSSWLNEHPEATTTVLDGSINEYKFTSTLRKKKANYYISVEKMKEDTSLITDIVCVTLGYYELNDGGGSTYKVRKKIATDIDDGGSIIFLNDELVAELIVENETVNVKQFGAHGNSVSDDYSYFNNAIDFSKKNGFEIKIPVGTFIISKQLNLKSVVGLKIIGSNDAPERYATKIIYSGTNSFLNLDGCKNVCICNFHLEANNGTGISLTGDRSFNCHFSDIYISNIIYGIYITATTGYTYFDRVKINVSNNTVNGIFIDCNNEIYTNYIYFRECAVDALFISDKTRTLVYLGNCYYIYFSHCDICNGHIAIAFDKNTDYIFINDTTLYNMDVGLFTLKSATHVPYIYATNTLLKCKTGLNEEDGLGGHYAFSSCSWNCTVHNIGNIKRPAKAYSCYFTNNLGNLKNKIFETCEAMNNKYYLSVKANSTENKEIPIIGGSMTENYIAISPDNELIIKSQSYDSTTKKIKLSVINNTNYDRGAYFFVC